MIQRKKPSSKSRAMIRVTVGTRSGHGTYTGSFTFFDIAMAKADSQENEKAIEEHKLQDFRRLMHNIHADGAKRTHTLHYDVVVFSEVRDGEQQWYAGVRIDEEAQSRWVKSLGVGDVVVVIPKTQYRAWFNYVSFARIDVYSSWLSAPRRGRSFMNSKSGGTPRCTNPATVCSYNTTQITERHQA